MGQVASHISGYFSDKDNEKEKLQREDNASKTTINSTYSRNKVKYDKNENNYNLNKSSSVFSIGGLATPRNPLKRTRQFSPITSLPQSILDIFSPAKKIRIDEEFLDFPFLCDEETIGYYKKSKILIVLRGLPGSGKSTIAKHIQRKYVSCRLCSADQFFMTDGEYVYDRSFIKDAHTQCQKNAIQAVQDQIPVIVIDNTNVKLWEMNFYFELADQYNYVPVVVEPQTPWRKELSALVAKNTHSIDKEIMSWKLHDYEEINPIYYGWFLNERDSHLIAERGHQWIKYAYKFEEFKQDFQSRVQTQSLQDLLDFFQRPSQGLLHCTSKYIGKRRSPENHRYVDDTRIDVGKAFDVEIVGFVLTPRTFGARLKLSEEEQLVAWSKDDAEEIPAEFYDDDEDDEDRREGRISEIQEKGDDVDTSFEQPRDFAAGLNGDHCGSANESCVETNSCNQNGGQEANVADSSATLSANNPDSSSTTEPENSISYAYVTVDSGVTDDSSLISDTSEVNTNEVSNTNGFHTSTTNEENMQISPSKIVTPKKNIADATSTKFISCPKTKALKKSPKKNKGGLSIPENTLHVDESATRETCAAIYTGFRNFTPTQGKGSRAHLTLGCAPDVKAVTTGLDLVLAVAKEGALHTGLGADPSEADRGTCASNGSSPLLSCAASQATANGNASSAPSGFPSISGDGVAIHNYGDGVWVFYLEEKLVVKSIFTAVL